MADYKTECNKIVTIKYLKQLTDGKILLSDGSTYQISDSRGDSYCPTYGELTDNSIVPYATEMSNWKDNVDGILIGSSYSGTQLVRQEDVSLVYTRYKNDSAYFILSVTDVSECGGEASSTTYATFSKSKTFMKDDCTMSTNYKGEQEFEYEKSLVSFDRNTYTISSGSTCNSFTGHGDSHQVVAQSNFSWRNVSQAFSGTVTQRQINFSANFKDVGIVQMDGATINDYYTISFPCDDKIIAGSVSVDGGEDNASIDIESGTLTIGRFDYDGSPSREITVTLTVSDGQGGSGTYDIVPCSITQYSAIPDVISSSGIKCEDKLLYLGEMIDCGGNI